MTVTHVAVMILAQCLIRSWASPLVYFNSLSSLPFGSGIHFSTSSLNRSTKWLYSNEFSSKHSNSTFGAACFLIIFISRHSLQRGQNPSVINNPAPPPIIGYPRIFRIFLTPPPNHPTSIFTVSQHFPSCVQLHYFNLYKSLLWLYVEGYQGVFSLSIRQD